jgi:uncharacterized protein YjbI with pentapeptide repeats
MYHLVFQNREKQSKLTDEPMWRASCENSEKRERKKADRSHSIQRNTAVENRCIENCKIESFILGNVSFDCESVSERMSLV